MFENGHGKTDRRFRRQRQGLVRQNQRSVRRSRRGGKTLEELCGKLPAIVSDIIEVNRNQTSARKADTLYCSFCGKSQYEVQQLIAGPGSFICAECVDLCSEIVETKRGNPDPAAKRAREIKPKNS